MEGEEEEEEEAEEGEKDGGGEEEEEEEEQKSFWFHSFSASADTTAAPRLTQTDLTEPQETHFWVQRCLPLDTKTHTV